MDGYFNVNFNMNQTLSSPENFNSNHATAQIIYEYVGIMT